MAKRKKVPSATSKEKGSRKSTAPAMKKTTPEKNSAVARKETVAKLEINEESGSDWPF